MVESIRTHDPDALEHALRQHLARQGLGRFVEQTLAPLTLAVGDRWEDGTLGVFEEHLYTESAKRLLRGAIAGLPAGGRAPRVLLTTAPGEAHGLGLLMVEALFRLEGATCISLGTETPLLDIARAATAYNADIVALSFSVAFPKRQILPCLRQLREALDGGIELWAGGAGLLRVEAFEGMRALPSLTLGRKALAAWHDA